MATPDPALPPPQESPPDRPRVRRRFAAPLLRRLGHFVARHRRNVLLRKLDSATIRYHQAFENSCYEFERNGEERVVRLIAASGPRVVFDVGANTGEWSELVRRHVPGASFHCFEPMEPAFRKLEARMAGAPNVRFTRVGLSDRAGTATFRYYPGADYFSGMYRYHGGVASQEVEVELTTGAEYCTRHGVDRIDFLKIDVEGAELLVLRGFQDLLAAGRVDVVQFEYGRVNVLSRALLADFYALFESLGYRCGKIYPTYVAFSSYHPTMEDFIGPNYLAVRAARSDLIAALRG